MCLNTSSCQSTKYSIHPGTYRNFPEFDYIIFTAFVVLELEHFLHKFLPRSHLFLTGAMLDEYISSTYRMEELKQLVLLDAVATTDAVQCCRCCDTLEAWTGQIHCK